MDVDGPCAAPQGTLIQEQTSPRPFNLGFRVPIHMAKKPLENPLEKPLENPLEKALEISYTERCKFVRAVCYAPAWRGRLWLAAAGQKLSLNLARTNLYLSVLGKLHKWVA